MPNGKLAVKLFGSLFSLFLLLGCTNQPDAPKKDAAKVVATENWDVQIPSTSAYNSRFILNKYDDGSISVSGAWTNSSGNTYDKNTSGTATINGTTVNITVSGTATSGSSTSSYTSTFTGTTSSGSGTGTFSTTFTAAGWTSSSGSWTGTRVSGSGVSQ